MTQKIDSIRWLIYSTLPHSYLGFGIAPIQTIKSYTLFIYCNCERCINTHTLLMSWKSLSNGWGANREVVQIRCPPNFTIVKLQFQDLRGPFSCWGPVYSVNFSSLLATILSCCLSYKLMPDSIGMNYDLSLKCVFLCKTFLTWHALLPIQHVTGFGCCP